MRCPTKEFLRITALLSALALTGYAQRPTPQPTKTLRAVPNFVTVTDQMMRAPRPENWLIHRGNYQAWGYSPLDQISKANVKNLQLVWSRAMEPGANEATPIVYNGVMYLGDPGDVIQAIDAATGDLMWEYRHPLPPAGSLRNGLGQRKRSIALYGDQVYFVTWDNIVVSLDARTGEVVWQTNRGGELDVSNSSGPIVANGVVIAGSTCQYSSHGCYVTGHDAKTGRELWRNQMIPHPGEPGDETWAGSPFESRWMTGVWGQITYDPELDLVYYGSTGVGPASEAQRKMPGATMAGTNTRFAVRPKTGEVVWKHQVLPRDNWDQECTFEMMIINTPVNPSATDMLSVNPNARRGPRKTLTGVPCKTGIAWSFDAATGEFLWAKPTTEQNIVARIDPKGLVTVNEDVKMGIILDGKVYHTPRMAAGRLGKMAMTSSSGPEGHDQPHDLDMFISNSALCERYASLVGEQGASDSRDSASRVSQIARLARKGDTHARQVVEDSGRYLGLAVANVAWAVDPEVIVIDGPITDAWQLLESPLLAQLQSFRGLLVVSSALKSQAPLIGAAMLALSTAAGSRRRTSCRCPRSSGWASSRSSPCRSRSRR